MSVCGDEAVIDPRWLFFAMVPMFSCQMLPQEPKPEPRCPDLDRLEKRLVAIETALALLQTTPAKDGFVCLPEDRD